MAFAHSIAGMPVEEWHDLETHLRDTACAAARFAACYGARWAYLAGLWHDAGKYSREFQRMIGVDSTAYCESPGRVDHSTAGALLATRTSAGLPLAFVIAGHHAGLANKVNLVGRLTRKKDLLELARAGGLPTEIQIEVLPSLPPWVRDEMAAELWMRFLYSALVDADFLDTEKFYKKEGRSMPQAALPDLQRLLDAHLETVTTAANCSAVNKMRARVLGYCRIAAEWMPGNFTLTVPTGGGKTLASMAFALDHAIRHNLRRVIVVLPFTSIIEQSAKTYREVFGEGVVIEHHSNLDPERETPQNRLASENWDAPVIVTTSVQFFESLFSNRSSRCRKLHNVAESVVVFDEVQTFPAELLAPITDVLNQLSEHYCTTQVFCTATQPALGPRSDTVPPTPGVRGLREIVADPPREFDAVRDRYVVQLPEIDKPAVAWEDLAGQVRAHPRVLVVVNRRDDAALLARLVGGRAFHLSARMCAAHRKDVLERIRDLLKSMEPCRVVSTQLIEAGVDIDFPVVFRAMAGADSLAQAAGRCNREGRNAEPGIFNVFTPPTAPPRGILRLGYQEAEILLRAGQLDLLSPQTFTRYFESFYNKCDHDAKGVNQARGSFNFEDTARLFHMIEDAGQPVAAPYGQGPDRVERLRREGPTRRNLRALQPFLVNLYAGEIGKLAAAGAIERVQDVVWSVVSGYEIYSERLGFSWQEPLAADPTSLIR
jgi:CRISPR-associated endonuclease/helicase Cas3